MREKTKGIISVFLSLFMILSTLFTGISASFVHAEDNRSTVYEGYTDKQQYSDFKVAFYVREKGSTDRGEMVFCFNESKKEPNTVKEGATEYTKVEGSAENFTKRATEPRIKDSELKKKILSVIYNAYHNKDFDKMGLSEGKLRETVQYSIWYFTDNTSKANGTREGHFQKPENATSKKLFEELIKGVPEAPENFELDLYLSKDTTKQDLLGTHIVDWEKEIKLVKEDAQTHDKLSGAVFKFVSGDGYVGDVEKEYTSSKDNPTIKIPSGIYRVTEKTPPKGYLVDSKSQTDGVVIKIDEAGNLYTRSLSQNYEQIWTKIENKELKFENKRNPDEPLEETVTLKVKKLWDNQAKTEHPDTKFGLFKDGVLQDDTVKTLSNGSTEITWTDIKKSEYQSYRPAELVEKDGKLVKAGKYITLGDKIYEAIINLGWEDEGNNVYSIKINNYLMNVIVVDKEYQDKDGRKIETDLPSINIHIETDNGTREDKTFDTNTTSNEYYIAASLKVKSFFEGNVQLQLNQQVEVTIGDKTYLATLTQTSENHYKIVNKEKSPEYVVKISKKAGSETGDELKGATLKIFNEEDDETTATPIQQWETTKTPQEWMLKEGSYKLVEAKAPAGYKKAETIHFTVNDDGTIATDGKQLQAGEPLVMIDKASQSVTIEKKVTGASGDKQKEFNFTITVNVDADLKQGEVLSGKLYKGGKTQDVYITAGIPYSFKLKDTDKLEVTGLVENSTYTLTEAEYGKDGYTTTVMVNDKEKKNADTDTTYLVVNGKNNIVFTNHNGKIVPTGILLDIMPYLIGMTFVTLSGIIFLLSIKRRMLNTKK